MNPQGNESDSEAHDRLKRLIRSRKLRATPARVGVLNYLENQTLSLVTHNELCLALETTGYDKSTLFRALRDFCEVGLLHRVDLGDRVWRYGRPIRTEVTLESSPREDHAHPHLLCTECGTLSCLDESDVKMLVRPSVGFVTEVLLKGRCNECGVEESA